MAIVTGPLHSIEARGSVGSLTYVTWRGRSVVKSRAGPATQYSAAQLALRAVTAAGNSAWQTLTDHVRSLWTQYAAIHQAIDWTGNPRRLTGHNCFIRCWVRTTLNGLTPPTLPPTDPNPWACLDPYIDIDAMDLMINWTAHMPLPAAQTQAELWMAGPFSQARTAQLPDAKRTDHTDYTDQVISWTPPEPGTWTAFLRTIDPSGQAGTWTRASYTVP